MPDVRMVAGLYCNEPNYPVVAQIRRDLIVTLVLKPPLFKSNCKLGMQTPKHTFKINLSSKDKPFISIPMFVKYTINMYHSLTEFRQFIPNHDSYQ